MNKTQIITCIQCPLGCPVTVASGNDGLIPSGHECRHGAEYALQEYRDPRRTLTGTIRVEGGFLPRLPVKTDEPIPRGAIAAAARELDRISVRAPIRCGQVLAVDLAGCGVNLVATRDLDSAP